MFTAIKGRESEINRIIGLVFCTRDHPPPRVTAAVVALCILGLFGCSGQTYWWNRPPAQPKETALASDSPAPLDMVGESQAMDYDPWESFNEQTFSFNFNVLDRHVLKPAAKVWSRVPPEQVRHGLANAFDNLGMPRRFINKALQGRLPGASEELARFVLNTTSDQDRRPRRMLTWALLLLCGLTPFVRAVEPPGSEVPPLAKSQEGSTLTVCHGALESLGAACWHEKGHLGQGFKIAVLDSSFSGFRALRRQDAAAKPRRQILSQGCTSRSDWQ